MIKIYLVDDQRILRDGLRALLEMDHNINVVGEAEDGRAALEGIRAAQPDVVLMDVTMPDLNGIDATQIVRKESPRINVLILSVHSDPEHVHRAFEAGAVGYLLKESAGAELMDAVYAVSQGRRYVSPKIEEMLSLRRDKRSPFESLSAREREVFQLMVKGSTSATIAENLKLSPKTVDTYRSRIMEKLGAGNLPELVRLAIKFGLTPPD